MQHTQQIMIRNKQLTEPITIPAIAAEERVEDSEHDVAQMSESTG